MSEFKNDLMVTISVRTLIETIATLAYRKGLEDRPAEVQDSDGNVVQINRLRPWPLDHAIEMLKNEAGASVQLTREQAKGLNNGRL